MANKNEHFQHLIQRYENLGTDLAILCVIINTIQDHLYYATSHTAKTYPPRPIPPTYFDVKHMHQHLTSAIQSQQTIGWHQFLRGRMSKEWAIAQEDF